MEGRAGEGGSQEGTEASSPNYLLLAVSCVDTCCYRERIDIHTLKSVPKLEFGYKLDLCLVPGAGCQPQKENTPRQASEGGPDTGPGELHGGASGSPELPQSLQVPGWAA